jgi:hypothetical protein
MAVKITTAMLDKMGPNGHDYMGCLSVRHILADAGVTDVELHVYEIEKIRQHRADAERATAAADAIEARGPWPDRGAVIPDGGGAAG